MKEEKKEIEVLKLRLVHDRLKLEEEKEKLREDRPNIHTPMCLTQYGNLHLENSEGWGKVELKTEFFDKLDEVLALDIVTDWIFELQNLRLELHANLYPELADKRVEMLFEDICKNNGECNGKT